MPFLEYSGKKILFLHIPKTGGESIEQWMESLGSLRFKTYGLPQSLKTAPQHMVYRDLKELFGPDYFDYIFAVVRDPYERIASDYKMRWLGNNSFFRQIPSFSLWLHEHVKGAAQNPLHLDSHLRPQVDFLGENCHIFKFETGIENIVKKVAADIGAPPPEAVPHSHSTKAFDGKIEWDWPELNLINSHYDLDFQNLDYEKRLPKKRGLFGRSN